VVMTALAAYAASSTKRPRSTKAEMASFREAIYQLVAANQPCSDRNVYYRAVTAHLVPKDVQGKRNNYTKVIRAIGHLRESGEMPFDWITDETRLRRGPTLFDGADSALKHWHESYRRDLWRSQARHVEVWVESDSVGSEVIDTTWGLGVNLYSCRGQSSKTLAWRCIQEWRRLDKPVEIIYLGDWDPTGLAIPKSLVERFARYGSDLNITVFRLTVLADDIKDLALEGHEVNRRDPNYAAFVEECHRKDLDPNEAVEVEAVEAPTLRGWTEDAITERIDRQAWEMELTIEEQEREGLALLPEAWRRRPSA
jgi:hypothetical protein